MAFTEVMARMQILVVNHQPLWAGRIDARLKAAGNRVWLAQSWPEAEALLEETWPDMILVEERILEREAPAMLAALRRGVWLPLILPTSFEYMTPEADRTSTRGDEALARIEGVVTRLQGVFEPGARQLIRVGKLTIDVGRREVVFEARRVPLPPHQFRLLLYLALNRGRVVEHRELLREVWGYHGAESEARELIKTNVRTIRRKLGWTDPATDYLQSVRGYGYMLSPPQKPKSEKSAAPAG